MTRVGGISCLGGRRRHVVPAAARSANWGNPPHTYARVQRVFYVEASVSSTFMPGCLALRATTKADAVEAGCCATLMRRVARWPETSSHHVRHVTSRLLSPPLASDTNAAFAAHEKARKGIVGLCRHGCGVTCPQA